MAPLALSTSYFTGSAFIGISMITLTSFGTSRPVGTRSRGMGMAAWRPGRGGGAQDTASGPEQLLGHFRFPGGGASMATRQGSWDMTGFASLDPEALATLRALDQDNPGAFSQFVRMFVGEAPELVRRLEAAVAANDEAARGQAAHYLRSASLALGATELAEICHALEHPSHALTAA